MQIAISGKQRSGKDTLAAFLLELLPDHTILRFSARLFQLCANLDGAMDYTKDGWEPQPVTRGYQLEVIREFLADCRSLKMRPRLGIEKQILKAYYSSPSQGGKNRKMLQRIGTDVCRAHISHDIWTRFLAEHLKPDIIIPDVRMSQEVNWLKKRGIPTIRLVRNIPGSGHKTETDLDNYIFEQTFDNSGSLETLKEYAASLVKGYHHQPTEAIS